MNTGYNNSFDPTPRLKSSPIPILFIPLKDDENSCSYCGNIYSMTLKFKQKYCKDCLFKYIQCTKNTTGNYTYLDMYISTNDHNCIKHKKTRKNFCSTKIQEWCEYCSEISYFRQITPGTISDYSKYDACYFILPTCRLYDERSGCYQISSGWVGSTLNKKPISILHLPWWDNYDQCVVCLRELKYINQESESYCQKWCSCCLTIYTGCRYCLTTNIIFGITDKSQCKKCERISFINIDIKNTISGNCIIDEFLASTRIDRNSQYLIANYMKNNTNLNPLNVYEFIKNLFIMKKPAIEWIPYSQIKNLEKIAEGGFSIIYKATWSVGTCDTIVAVKQLSNSQNVIKYVLNELKSLYHFYEFGNDIINCYGISQNPLTKEYMLIMEYANGGSLSDHLQNHFVNITWTEKINILVDISYRLQIIHKNNYIHRDIHSGNILLSNLSNLRKFGILNHIRCWKIGDLGLSQSASNTLSNNEIYGVIPYIAPEIFEGAAFSKESDIYSFGMIMWELTTGRKPFADVEHNINLIYKIIDGKRPEITNDTPECYANLLKKCWNSDPLKRPTVHEILKSATKWNQSTTEWILSGIPLNDPVDSIDLAGTVEQAEIKRLELIQLKKLGPRSVVKSHSKAVFTSRALSSFISKPLTTGLSSIISFNLKQEYITKEYELDINNIQSLSTNNTNSAQNFLNFRRQNAYNSKPLSKLIATATANTSRKRNIEELNIETQNDRKHTKTDNSD